MTAESILTIDQVSALEAAMTADGHCCYRPTHILRNDQQEIVGAFSIECAPVLYFWMDSRRRNPLASVRAYKLAEQEFLKHGHERIILPVEASSPFFPFVTELGYSRLGSVELFEKEIMPHRE